MNAPRIRVSVSVKKDIYIRLIGLTYIPPHACIGLRELGLGLQAMIRVTVTLGLGSELGVVLGIHHYFRHFPHRREYRTQ